MTLHLKPVCPTNESFLYEVYSSTRQDELAMLDWTESEEEAFLQMQFQAQRQGYMKQFPDADWRIIVLNDLPVGRLIVDRRKEEVGLMDIALIPQYRNQGIGTHYIKQVMAEASDKKLPARLYVEKNNDAAYRLYKRLGFTRIGETGMHIWMEWRPEKESVIN